MNPNESLVSGLLLEAIRRNNSRNGNPRYLIHLKMPDGEMRTYPTKTDCDVNYDIPNIVGQEVTFVIDKINRIVDLQSR